MNLANIRNLILDMDGVLWRGNTPAPGLISFFEQLRRQNRGFVMATNNASKTAAQYVKRFAEYGVTITDQDVITSSQATASYLQKEHPPGTKVFVIGETGLKTPLREAGFDVVESDIPLNEPVPLVAVGFSRLASYKDFAHATVYVNRGAQFIGTNPDKSFPHEWGELPGAGALQALITAASGVEPLHIGKPGPIMFQEAMRRLDGNVTNTVMVGDRLNTDIQGGQSAGLATILLLSGISSREDVAHGDIKPTWIFEDLAALTQALLENE